MATVSPVMVVAALAIAACAHSPVSRSATEGERVSLTWGDTMNVGALSIRVEADRAPTTLEHLLGEAPRDADLLIKLQEGSRADSRGVSDHKRTVKFGAHVVAFEEKGSGTIEIQVTSWKPASPLAPGDARMLADEALSPDSPGEVSCDDGARSTDGKSYVVHCSVRAVSDHESRVTVDAVSGNVLSVVRTGGA